MLNTYLCDSCSINIPEGGDNIFDLIEYIFSYSESLISLITSLLVAALGVYGIKYLNKIKEKNLNATFGYYTRLKVRLHVINSIWEEFHEQILDRFIPEGERNDIEPSKKASFDLAIKELVTTAEETLLFLKNAEDQMPASSTWVNEYEVLLELLEDCIKIQNIKYYKWKDSFTSYQNEYYDKHKTNMSAMMKSITAQQEEIQGKLYKN